MNVLTFDIEDWYNCDFISNNINWDKFEVRIYAMLEKVLEELAIRKYKATFFCLGWMAEKHPDVIRLIHAQQHHFGCHSYKHDLLHRFDRLRFKQDTEQSKNVIEDIIGDSIDAYRAPGFSISEKNIWALEVLAELGFKYDCSIFPGRHDYGGFQSYDQAEPAFIQLGSGLQLKEFPVSAHCAFNRRIIFSGGGYFRLFPYWLIKRWASSSSYLMTYFHMRDFDPDQPVVNGLPLIRKLKSYVGLSSSYKKFQRLLDDFKFVSVREADESMDWRSLKTINMNE